MAKYKCNHQASDAWNKSKVDPMGKKASSGYQEYPKAEPEVKEKRSYQEL